ncbi:protein ITPRID2-like isoform X3 [Scleropages formosus]|uniref:protein ITPRID2-like isoform X3 n=1 Tax=Scleropages formosus TaxID=113540 RepID=UPI0008788CB6|nr:protein ITPRID2-like isoform X3 [Scleropages formosus]
MEREAVPTGVPMHSWQCADARRRAWAHSRDSCQVSHSQGEVQDGGATEGKTPLAEEMGRIPSKIATWLQECRTPLGSSLDESNQGLPRGTARNGCSFEDDLSLGAEANYLQASGTATLSPCSFGGLAKEKRSQFQQRASSMNSTGSGRSNTTVSSISELLDLYEEDPEEVLYNLGFGIEEPDIASKVPARFFSSASNAKGIDMKVYLGAQLKRMELENPSYALTSRFRQIEVLTTVANAFSVLYSQVSGAPVQQIGGGGSTESREPPPLRRNNSALNAAKLLKKSLTRLSLQNPAEEGSQAQVAPTLPIRSSSAQEQRHPPSLATVTEEALPSRVAMETEEEQGREPDRLPSTALARVRLAHMLPQKCDSFEMEEVPPTEVQSLEGEALLLPGGAAKAPGADLQRMASQHSDSSGFAEDPPADGLASPLKVQDSADSYDSDATVTSATVGEASALALHHTTFPGLGDEDILTVSLLGDSLPLYQEAFSGSSNTHWSMEQVITFNPNQTVDPAEGQDSGPIAEPGSTGDSSHTDELGPIAERGSTADSSPPKELSSDPVCGPAVMQDSGFEEVPTEPIPARAVTISQPGLQRGRRVWLKPQDLLVQGRRQRFPLQRSHSLPTSLLGPTCVVSSVRIQLRPGTTRCCTPPSFSYRYTPEDEEASSVSGEQEGEEEERTSCRSVLLVNRPAAPESGPSVMMQEGRYLPERRPAHPLHLPPYLSCSASSLQSSPPEWSQRVPGEHMRDWSSFSVPNLQAHSAPSSSVCNCHSSTQPKQYPLHISLNALPAQQIAAHNSQHGTPYVNNQQRTPHSSSLHSVPYSFSCSNLQSAPFNPPCDNLHGAPCSSSCSNLHSVPSSCPWSHVQNVPLSGPHLWEDSTSRRSTELQLQEILQEIRASVQHLSQLGLEEASVQRPPMSMTQLNVQELQATRRALSAFRSHMTELEVDLVRQQAFVYQHLSVEERQEVVQLQQLRSSVRQELQELELQLEGRLLALDEHLRPSHHIGLCRHRPASLQWCQSTDSLFSTSAVNAMETVSELLREQVHLKEELGFEGGVSADAPLGSTLSSRSTSPLRPSRNLSLTLEPCTHAPPPKRFYSSAQPPIYRASMFLTPVPPPRSGPAVPAGGTLALAATVDGLEQGAVGGDSTGSGTLEMLIKEIKESITVQVRQEIVNELLSAVSPRRCAMIARKDTS